LLHVPLIFASNFFLSGWTPFNEARVRDFDIPRGRYYLADASFALSEELLVPYHGVLYNLSEWDHAKEASCNPQELFNLRHASARNIIERIFGILKRRFRILQLPPEYDMNTQAQIPAALAALHNFIRQYDPDEVHMYEDDQSLDFQIGDPKSAGELGRVTPNERARANDRRDKIADGIWQQHQHCLESRAAIDPLD